MSNKMNTNTQVPLKYCR